MFVLKTSLNKELDGSYKHESQHIVEAHSGK